MFGKDLNGGGLCFVEICGNYCSGFYCLRMREVEFDRDLRLFVCLFESYLLGLKFGSARDLLISLKICESIDLV